MTAAGRTALAATLLARINDNAAGEISAADVRTILTDMIDSDVNSTDDDVGTLITGSDPTGTIYQRNASGSLVPAALTETTTTVTATKSVETPPSALRIGGGITVSSGLNTLVFKQAGGTSQSIISMMGYTSTGSETPIFYKLATEVQFPVTTVFDTQLTEPQTITFVPAVASSFVTKFMFRPAEAGTLRVEGFTGTDVNGDLVVDETFTVSAGQVGTNVEFEVPSPVLSFIGDQFTVRASGIDVFGGLQTVTDYNGQTLPFVTLIGHVVTNVQYTTVDTFNAHFGADTAIPASVVTALTGLTGSDRLSYNALRETPQIPAQADQHFISAEFINSTRTLRFTRENTNTLDVIIPESTSGFLAPAITEFSLPGTPSRIDTTDDLIGDVNIRFHVSNSANINTLTLEVNGINVGNVAFGSDGVLTEAINISSGEWTSIITADSTKAEFQLVGTDKDTPAGAVTSATIEVTIRDQTDDEFFYYGTSSTNNPASVSLASLSKLTAATGDFNLNDITTTAGHFIILLYPQDHALTSLRNRRVNDEEVLTTFTETTSVRTENSQAFDSRVFGPTTGSLTQRYAITLA